MHRMLAFIAAKDRFAKIEACQGATPGRGMPVSTPASGPAVGYKLDAKGKCYDARGKMAKKDLCKAA
jgi:hypothetical protein